MDREKILNKLAEMDGYMAELKKILPKNFNDYETSLEKRRACERLLHISVETILDICNILVSELKLGLPASEEDVLIKLRGGGAGVFNGAMFAKLKKNEGIQKYTCTQVWHNR